MSELIVCAVMAAIGALLLRLAEARGLMLALAIFALVGGCFMFAEARTVEPRSAVRSVYPGRAPRSLAAERHAFTGRFTPGERWLGMADAIASRGDSASAANVLVAAVKQHPRDYSLWVGLGNMLTDHGGRLNPGARLAYERAIALAPDYPAPRYFLGIAEARSGNVAEARRLWSDVLANSPANASWRPLVEDRLAQTAP